MLIRENVVDLDEQNATNWFHQNIYWQFVTAIREVLATNAAYPRKSNLAKYAVTKFLHTHSLPFRYQYEMFNLGCRFMTNTLSEKPRNLTVCTS
jgi:hypothetical protein